MLVRNPRTGQNDYTITPPTAPELASLCDNLRTAQSAWQSHGIEHQISVLQRWKEAAECHKPALQDTLVANTGRKWESVLETDLLLSSIDRWCRIGREFFVMTDAGRFFRLENSFFQRVFPLFARKESSSPGNVYTLDTTLYGLPSFNRKRSSSDAGRTWTQLQDDAMIPSQVMKVQFNGQLVAVGYVYARQPNWVRSTVTGRTWQIIGVAFNSPDTSSCLAWKKPLCSDKSRGVCRRY